MPRMLLLAAALLAVAADWPQFLGPTRDGASPETVSPWKDPPKVLWRQPVGDAHSSPVVADGVVYAFFKPAGKDADALAAFNATTGEKKWEQSYDRAKFSPPYGVGPRGTPSHPGRPGGRPRQSGHGRRRPPPYLPGLHEEGSCAAWPGWSE